MPHFLELQFPVPDLETQNQIVRVNSDAGVLHAALAEYVDATERDWRALGEIADSIDQLKAVLDIDRRIADWWQELPYPLATALVAALFTEGRQVRGVERARITFEIAPDRARWGTEIAGKVKAWATALTGPTSLPGKYPQLMNPPGSETGPGQIATWGKSTIFSVDAFGYNFQWTTNSSKHIPFDWTGP